MKIVEIMKLSAVNFPKSKLVYNVYFLHILYNNIFSDIFRCSGRLLPYSYKILRRIACFYNDSVCMFACEAQFTGTPQ
jgi:hypothetical protein